MFDFFFKEVFASSEKVTLFVPVCKSDTFILENCKNWEKTLGISREKFNVILLSYKICMCKAVMNSF